MFSIEHINDSTELLVVELPTGKTQEEIIQFAEAEIGEVVIATMSKHVQITGRITTSLAMYLGHKLAHTCKSVSILDPKEGTYVCVVWH